VSANTGFIYVLVFLVLTMSSVAVGYRRFGAPYFLSLQVGV